MADKKMTFRERMEKNGHFKALMNSFRLRKRVLALADAFVVAVSALIANYPLPLFAERVGQDIFVAETGGIRGVAVAHFPVERDPRERVPRHDIAVGHVDHHRGQSEEGAFAFVAERRRPFDQIAHSPDRIIGHLARSGRPDVRPRVLHHQIVKIVEVEPGVIAVQEGKGMMQDEVDVIIIRVTAVFVVESSFGMTDRQEPLAGIHLEFRP